jgi:hypothetical protein
MFFGTGVMTVGVGNGKRQKLNDGKMFFSLRNDARVVAVEGG